MNKFRLKNQNPILNGFAIGENMNLEELTTWIEGNGHKFNDHFTVRENDIVLKRPNNTGDEVLMVGYTLVCDEDGDYMHLTPEQMAGYETISEEELALIAAAAQTEE